MENVTKIANLLKTLGSFCSRSFSPPPRQHIENKEKNFLNKNNDLADYSSKIKKANKNKRLAGNAKKANKNNDLGVPLDLALD